MDLDFREALRYLGVSTPPDGLLADMTALAARLTAEHPPRWVWRRFDLRRRDGALFLGDLPLPGRTASTMLTDCREAVALVCTLGLPFEARARAMQLRDMSRAVMLDALGSAWVESGCDAASDEIAARFPSLHLTDRFSPGYGDLPLDLQPALLALTDASRRLGVHSTDTHLLTPQKSVTALIGLADRPQQTRVRGCAFCSLRDTCNLRKVGTTCHV